MGMIIVIVIVIVIIVINIVINMSILGERSGVQRGGVGYILGLSKPS